MASSVGTSSLAPKSCEFNSQSGRIARFGGFNPRSGHVWKTTNLSPCLSKSIVFFIKPRPRQSRGAEPCSEGALWRGWGRRREEGQPQGRTWCRGRSQRGRPWSCTTERRRPCSPPSGRSGEAGSSGRPRLRAYRPGEAGREQGEVTCGGGPGSVLRGRGRSRWGRRGALSD